MKNTLAAMGYTISVPALLSMFESCTDQKTGGAEGQFFSGSQSALIGELAETILPKTQTPGAKDLKLDLFIDRMVKDVFKKEDQEIFVKEMEEFEKGCREMNGKDFGDCDADQRAKYLAKMESESAKTVPSIWGFSVKPEPVHLPFYRKVKELTLLGYFTAEEIGKNVLHYNPVPGHYLGDIPLSQVGGKIAFE